ncbi:MAG: hypothetical protein LBH24_07310 [Clostridiales bacterium]|jgi:hypothetical protein|nr:hypothetical protein [Clostridiales bacterium]
MGLFDRKKGTAETVNARERVEATIEQTEAFVYKAEKKRRELLDRAKTAKARGDKLSYSMAVNALRTVMLQQKRAEQMVLSMQIMLDYRDVNALTGSFMESMQFMCSEMGQMPDLKKMSKVADEFNKNMAKAAHQTALVDEYMTAMSESMSAMDYEDVPQDDEIGRLIESQLAAELDAEDIEIAKKLQEAKEKLDV